MFHKRLLREFSDNRGCVIGMVVLQWISLLANVALMLTVASFLAAVVEDRVTVVGMREVCIALASAIVLRMAASTANSRLSFAASSKVKVRLRELIYEKLMRLGASYRETITTAEAVQVSTEGVDQLEIYFGKYVPQFFYSLLAPLTLFVIVGSMSLKVAAVLLICVPLIPMSIVAVQKFAKKLLAKYWGTYTELGDTFLENLQGLTTLKIYQADERYAEKMDEEAEKFRKITMRVLIMQLNSISVMDIVAYGGAAVGIILSIRELACGNISVAQCFFIIMISAEFFLPLRLLGSFFHIAMNGNAAADKIFRFLDAPEIKEGSICEVKGSDITFSDVNFSYDGDRQVLKDISFTVPEKQFVALVGVSGCGKSTTASLLMGENRNYTGSVCVGGTEVREIAPDALYHKITRVRHDSYLFRGTVEENLKMGKPDATEAEMEQVLRQVELWETVQEKGGLSMPVAERAENLSGGQKQRLALARAILHDSDIYIFDEAASNIDADSENKIMEAIRELAKKKTIILISHRLANVVKADRIFVMKDGAICEQGTHEELLAENGYYHNLYETQKELERYATGEEMIG